MGSDCIEDGLHSLAETDQLSEAAPGVDPVTEPAIVFVPAAPDVQEDIASATRVVVPGVQMLAPTETSAVGDVAITVSTSFVFAASLPVPSVTAN